MVARFNAVPALASMFHLLLPASEATLPTSGQLNLRNDAWDAVQVEVRVGPSGLCDDHPSAGVRTLRRGQVWAVVTEEAFVCWRREANPGAGTGAWAPWASQPMAADSTQEVSL